jgi:hypothetical protein
MRSPWGIKRALSLKAEFIAGNTDIYTELFGAFVDPGISRLENAFYALSALFEFTRWDMVSETVGGRMPPVTFTKIV